MFLTKQFVGRTIALCEFRWEETVKLEFGQHADLVDIRRIGIPRAFVLPLWHSVANLLYRA